MHPALYPRNLFPNSKYTLFWQGNQSPQLADRKPIVPSGGTLGGGSAINWMVYTRGQRSDYDSWKTKGWAADDMLPFMKKVNTLGFVNIYLSTDSEQFENYHGLGDRDAHGDSGPVNISKGTHCCKQAEQSFIDSANEMGYSELKDLQNLDANNATERWLKYIGPNGRRQDAAHRYVHNKIQSGDYPNLHVVCEKQVIRVLFDDDKKAVGVEYQSNPKFRKNSIEINDRPATDS